PRLPVDDASSKTFIIRTPDAGQFDFCRARRALGDRIHSGPRATMPANIRLRLAVPEDIPVLRELVVASVRGLQSQDYTPAQIEGALETVFGVDSQLIADGTYMVAQAEPAAVELTRAKSASC